MKPICARQQAPLKMVYFLPMCALCDTSLLSVFHHLRLYLGWRCALDIPSQHLTVQLPCRVPVSERKSLDLYFACAAMDANRDVFFDDHRVLQLVVTTTPPSPSISNPLVQQILSVVSERYRSIGQPNCCSTSA